jgi:hypothetical protein
MVNAQTFGWTNKVQIMMSFSFVSQTYVDTTLFCYGCVEPIWGAGPKFLDG